MEFEEVRPYCPFVEGSCTQALCGAYQKERPLTDIERCCYLAADIPPPTCVKNWCLKYDKLVASTVRLTKEV